MCSTTFSVFAWSLPKYAPPRSGDAFTDNFVTFPFYSYTLTLRNLRAGDTCINSNSLHSSTNTLPFTSTRPIFFNSRKTTLMELHSLFSVERDGKVMRIILLNFKRWNRFLSMHNTSTRFSLRIIEVKCFLKHRQS